MGKKTKNTVIIVVLLIIIVAFVILRQLDENTMEEKIISGLVVNKEDSNKENQLTIETFGEKEDEIKDINFKVRDEKLWDKIEVGNYYFLIYIEEKNGGLVVERAEKNETYKKVYKNYLAKSAEKKETEVVEEKESKEDEKKEKYIAIFPSTDKITTGDLTLLDNAKVDLNGDKREENIELYTTAQRDSSGDIMWDDGQKWFLIVRDEDKEYLLFDEYVQLGVLDYWVFNSDDKCYIVTLQTGSAVFKLSAYTYDNKKGAFIKKDIYNPEFLNLVHGSSIR